MASADTRTTPETSVGVRVVNLAFADVFGNAFANKKKCNCSWTMAFEWEFTRSSDGDMVMSTASQEHAFTFHSRSCVDHSVSMFVRTVCNINKEIYTTHT